MSGIAALLNIPGTSEEFLVWLTAHATHHFNINQALYNDLGIAMPTYVLDPLDPNDKGAVGIWAYQHQDLHNVQNQILGIEGLDLTEIDWDDRDSLASWVQANFSEHYQASQLLRIG